MIICAICIIFIIVNGYLLYTANAPFTKEEAMNLSTSTDANSLRGGLYKRYVNHTDTVTDFYLVFAAFGLAWLSLYI